MTDGPLIRWDWVATHLDLIGERLTEHLWLTFLAVAIGTAISLPISIAAYRSRRLYAVATWVTGVMYTIPSIALFVLLLPFTGLTTLTAEIGLVSYTLLILIRNMVVGLRGVPEGARDAAVGMGYTRWQLLRSVEVPLAVPAIVAGIRIATVTTIGLVTVTALIGKGGLGFLMLAGFRNLYPRFTAIAVGLALTVVLALAFDGLLLLGQRLLTPWSRTRAGVVRT